MNDTVITGSHFIFLDNEKLSVDQTFNLKGCKLQSTIYCKLESS